MAGAEHIDLGEALPLDLGEGLDDDDEVLALGVSGAGEPAQRDLQGEGVVVALADGSVEEQGAGEHIEFDHGPLVVPRAPRPKYAWRSSEHVANARLHRSLKISQAKADNAESALDDLRQGVQSVATLLPGAAELLGSSGVTAVGRLRPENLQAHHFALLCRAAFMSSRNPVRLGINFKRLLAAAVRVIVHRQHRGLAFMITRSHEVLNSAGAQDNRMVHLSFSLLWDEVNSKFIWHGDKGHRRSRIGVHQHTIVQRGGLCLTLADEARDQSKSYYEVWLVQPQQVLGTSAAALWPAVEKACPKELRLTETKSMEQIAERLSSYTHFCVGDKASGNLSLQKKVGEHWENHILPRTEGKVLYWPETCVVHLHHRCKLQVRSLKFHTMRQFSIANLLKLASVRSRILENVERALESSPMSRHVGARPVGLPGSLAAVIEILYKPGSRHHLRRDGKASQRLEDLRTLVTMVNGNLNDGSWTHFCWDEAAGKPCCDSLRQCRDKTVRAVTGALFGDSDPIPAESRWTHTLANFKKCILRKCVYGIGVNSFPGRRGAAELQMMDVDGQAADGHQEDINKTRLSRTQAYFEAKSTFSELVVLTLVVDVVDSNLLYSLLGDPVSSEEDDRPSKAQLLLDPDESVLGACSRDLLQLLDNWLVGGSERRPWCLMDIVGAPVREQACMMFARSTILRMWSSVARRYLTRYGTWPYLLYTLCNDKSTEAEKRSVADRLLGAHREELDVYSVGIRALFDTPDKLLGKRCRWTLAADFRSLPVSTDVIERLNAEVTATTPGRGASRSFANTSRQSFLKQALAVHKSRGGAHPLGVAASRAAGVLEHASSTPFVLGSEQEVPSPTLPNALAPPAARAAHARSTPAPRGTGDASAQSDVAVPPGNLAIVAASNFWGDPVVVQRQNAAAPLPLAPQPPARSQTTREKRGLNPYMLELNKTMKAARENKGAALSVEETKQIRESFRQQWDAINDHESFREAYDEWRSELAHAKDRATTKYRTMWGGGCHQTPITAEEFWQWHREFGWPGDKEVYTCDSEEIVVKPDTEATFPDVFHLWGCGRWARNIRRSTVLSVEQFNTVEAGLNNFVESLGRVIADSAEVMVVIDGKALGGDGFHRVVALVTGTSYSPKVLDFTPCGFDDPSNESSAELQVPCMVHIMAEPNRAAPRFQGIAFKTSDEFVMELTTNFETMSLSVAVHDIDESIDGSLRWSRITGLRRIGVLWEPNAGHKLLGNKKRGRATDDDPEAVFKRLRSEDPLSAPSRPARARQQRGGGAGRSSGRRGRGLGAHGSVLDFGGASASSELAAIRGQDEEHQAMSDQGPPGIVLEAELEALIDEDEVDLAEAESDLSDFAIDEFGATYGERVGDSGGFPLGNPQQLAQTGDDLPESGLAAEEDTAILDSVIEGVTGLGSEVGLAPPGANRSSGSADPPPPDEDAESAVEPEAPAPWEAVGDPSASGYCYLGGRQVMRVQYGKPKNSCTITCYRHSGCHLLLGMARVPELSALKRWLFEVEANPPGASAQQRKALAKEHSDIGKGRWSAKAQAGRSE